jgi:hypothetical protein
LKLKRLIVVSLLTIILVLIPGCQGTPNEAESQKIALSFLENSPTYKFDGVGGSIGGIKLAETKTLSNDGWVFTYEFDCVYPGYGDRSGFPPFVPGKLTRHTAVIVITGGKVNSAFIDSVWDMQRQAYVEVEDQGNNRLRESSAN